MHLLATRPGEIDDILLVGGQSRMPLVQLADGDVIFVAAADRLVRQTREFLELLSVLEEKGADLVLLEEHFDTRSPAGRQGIKLLRTFAQLDFQYQSTRKKQGIQAARGQGGDPLLLLRGGDDLARRIQHGEGGVAHLQVAVETTHLPDEEAGDPGPKLSLPPRQEVRLAEEGGAQFALPVTEPHFQPARGGPAAG